MKKKVTGKMISQMSRQSLRSGRMRNTFVMVTIILAAALLTAILMFAMGQKQQVKNELRHRQQVGYYNLTEEQAETLKTDERIAYQIQVKTGILFSAGNIDVIPYYVNELSDQIRVGELETGKMPERENEIAVQAAMLQKMGIAAETGSRVEFAFPDGNTETFTVSGILKGNDTAKQFAVFFSESYAKKGSQLKDMPYEVYAKLFNAENMHPEECKELMYLIGGDAQIERKNVNPSKAFIDSISVDMQSVLIYGMVGVVILLACFLVIYGVFYLSVIGRIHQFGQLRTIGMTKKQMKKFVSREGGILFLRSVPIGIVIGGIAGYFIIPDGFSVLNLFAVIILVLLVIYLITMISILKPAGIAAAVSPMEALRYVPQDGMKKPENKKICRPLTPFGLGVMNFTKNRKKAVITMLSLGFGGILFMTAATYMSSFNKEKYARQGYFENAQFHITYAQSAIELNEYGKSGLQAQTPLGDRQIQEIAALDGVTGITQVKGFGVRFDYPEHDEYDNDDEVYPLTEAETKEIGKYLAEGSADFDKLMSGNYILVAGNGNAEEIYGWQFEVGGRIVLHYYDGNRMSEKEMTILGILNDQFVLDHNGMEGWFLMPEQAVLENISYGSINTHLLVSAEEDKEEAVGESLKEMVEARPELTMETLAERKAAYEQSANQIFGMISGLAVFIMMFSILSMMNTLITNIVTKKQELAMLESIGMDKRQIRNMLCVESLILVAVTVGVTMTAGTLCGYLLSTVLYQRGAFYMAFRFPAVFALAYAAVLVFVPLFITFVSIRSFSKEALVDRLRTGC